MLKNLKHNIKCSCKKKCRLEPVTENMMSCKQDMINGLEILWDILLDDLS